MSKLAEDLKEAFGLVQHPKLRKTFHTPELPQEKRIYLKELDLGIIPAHDTQVVRLIMNGAGEVSKAWHTLLEQLETTGADKSVANVVTEAKNARDGSFFGRTLLYQAVLDDTTTSHKALEVLLENDKGDNWLYRRAANTGVQQPLADSSIPGGHIWLFAIPKCENEEHIPTSVYLALVEKASEEQFFNNLNSFAEIDLIAHKGYFLRRQYRCNKQLELYRENIEELRTSSSNMLRPHSHSFEESFSFLKKHYVDMVETTTIINTLRIDLEKQKDNYEIWIKHSNIQDLMIYHQRHIETALMELNHAIDEGKSALEASHTTLEFIEIEDNKNRERRDKQVNILLAIGGLILALSEIITGDIAEKVLCLFSVVSFCDPAEQEGVTVASLMLPLIVQVVLLIGLTAVLVAIWKGWLWRAIGRLWRVICG
jgi:hypothetical protein